MPPTMSSCLLTSLLAAPWQDFGPGYRNVIGIPGGVNSVLFSVLQVDPTPTISLLLGYGPIPSRRWALLKGIHDAFC